MFEKAKWICGDNSENDGSNYIRYEFETEKPVKSAILSICALGYGVTEINGESVTDEVLSTPFTAFDKRVLYNEYDVTQLIKTGKNAICTEIGNGWYNAIGKTWNYEKAPWRSGRKMIAEIKIIFEDDTEKTVASSRKWKTKEGSAVYNHVREGETCDARLKAEGAGCVGFDDGDWKNACMCNPPGGKIEKAELTPIRKIRELKAKNLGGGIYDFGENISGWVRIKVKAESGREITLRYSERYENGNINTENINMFTEDRGHTDSYIACGKGEEVWQPRFVYHGFRYVKAENAPKDFEIEAVVVHTDLETVGTFECSDEMLNKIHEASVRSTLTNYHSIPTDCPHREQNGWTGDGSLSSEQALMNFDMTEAYKKWMKDFKDAQRPNGQLPGIVPTGGWGFNWGSGPAWDSAMFMIPWNVYGITGNTELIFLMWENMKRYMEYIISRSESYIADFGLGDWCPPDPKKICPNNVTDTAYFYACAKIMQDCAGIVGEDKTEYEKLAENVKKAWQEKFIGDTELEKYQTYYACGIYWGLFDDTEAAVEKLKTLIKENDYHIDCGILGTKFIFSALAENGEGGLLYKMVTNPTYPSYAYWINEGMTTLCENWDMSESLNHHMFSEVDNWFYKYLGGIRFEKGEVTVKPVFTDEIKSVKANSRGVEVCWDENEVRITLPKGGRICINGNTEMKPAGEYVYKR